MLTSASSQSRAVIQHSLRELPALLQTVSLVSSQISSMSINCCCSFLVIASFQHFEFTSLHFSYWHLQVVKEKKKKTSKEIRLFDVFCVYVF